MKADSQQAILLNELLGSEKMPAVVMAHSAALLIRPLREEAASDASLPGQENPGASIQKHPFACYPHRYPINPPTLAETTQTIETNGAQGRNRTTDTRIFSLSFVPATLTPSSP